MLYNLDAWEIIVLRAAIAKHIKDCPEKHRISLKRIIHELSKHDKINLNKY